MPLCGQVFEKMTSSPSTPDRWVGVKKGQNSVKPVIWMLAASNLRNRQTGLESSRTFEVICAGIQHYKCQKKQTNPTSFWCFLNTNNVRLEGVHPAVCCQSYRPRELTCGEAGGQKQPDRAGVSWTKAQNTDLTGRTSQPLLRKC